MMVFVNPEDPQKPQQLPTPANPNSTPSFSAGQSSDHLLQTAAKRDRARSFKKGLRGFLSLLGFVATVIVAAAIINHFIFQSYYVDGTSMTPTLQNNDRLIIDKTGKTIAAIQGKPYIPGRGDIVVLDSSILDQYGNNEQLIKRVIGLPGDDITIADGIVTIKNASNPNGFDVNESLGLDLSPTYSPAPVEITVPEDNVFVMGDNRGPNGSFDSRAFGPVPSDKIEGRLALRVFPFDHIKTF